MNYKKKIRNIIIITPSLSGGGAEKVATNIANLFHRNGYLVTIVSIYKKNKVSYKVDKNINQLYLNKKRLSSSILNLRKILNQSNTSIVISFLTITNICVSLSRIFRKRKHLYIYTQHEIPSKTYNKKFNLNYSFLIPFLMKLTYKYADKIICVSYGLEKEMAKLFKNKINNKITTIYNLINNDNISLKSINNLYNQDNKLNLLSIGRLVLSKDFETIISAVNLIKNKINISLNIVGEGKEKNKLLELINKNKLENICKIYDFVEDLYPFYTEANIYISASLHESFGNTLIEAMHHNLLIISTDCPYGPKEILQNGYLGELIKIKAPQELANAIIKTSKKNKNPNYKNIINQCGNKIILEKYKELFDELESSNKYLLF